MLAANSSGQLACFPTWLTCQALKISALFHTRFPGINTSYRILIKHFGGLRSDKFRTSVEQDVNDKKSNLEAKYCKHLDGIISL